MGKKYTPGPWFASDWSNDYGSNLTVIEVRTPENKKEGTTSVWPDGIVKSQIASTEYSCFDDEECIANAHLIASAPDLLEALEEIYTGLNVCSDNMNISDDQIIPVDITMVELRKARAAIRKAYGEQE